VKTLLLGPLFSLLPRRWREANSLSSSICWPVAGALSGLMESLLALLALVSWYSYSVTHWAGDAVYAAIRAGAQIPANAVGFAALAVMCLHPLTWLIGFAAIEGVVRFMGAAFAQNVLGIAPFFVLDKLLLRFSPGSRPERPAETEEAWSSFFNFLRQQVVFLRHPVLPDEVLHSTDAAGGVMSIGSSRAKPGWKPPKVVRCGNEYYRLESSSERAGPRPFLYLLRRLPAGVPGRTVINYRSEDAIARRG
jgi:hypothetical protein